MHRSREILNHDIMEDLPEQAAQNRDMPDSPEHSAQNHDMPDSSEHSGDQNHDMLDSPEHSATLGESGARTTSSNTKTKEGSSTTVRRKKSSDEPTKKEGDMAKDEPNRERSKNRVASPQKGRRSSVSAVDESSPTAVRRKKSSDEPNVSIKTDGDGEKERHREELKRERSKSRLASPQKGRRSSVTAVDEPSISTKTDGDEAKGERSKSKKVSSTPVRRTKSADEPNGSTNISEDRDESKTERSKSRVASQNSRGRRSSMSAVDEPNISTKRDGKELKREHSKSQVASRHRGRRSSMSGAGESSVSTKTGRDGSEKEHSKSKISLQHRGRRSSMSAVTDSTLSGLECPGFLLGGRENQSSTPSSRDSSGRKRSTEASSKHHSGSQDKHRSRSVSQHRSGSPSKQHSSSRSSKHGASSSRSRSKPDNQLGSSPGVSPSKRGSQSPRTQNSSSSRSHSTRSQSLAPTSEGQRKRSQDSIKLLVASIDIDFADDFKVGENSASTAVKKSEKARQARLASVDPTDSPETARQARLLVSVEPTDSPEADESDSHQEKEIAYWPKRERKPSVAPSGASRTMAIRSSVWINPARPKDAESEVPEIPESLDAQKHSDGRRMTRRMSNPAVAAASTVLARNVASPSEAITTALTNSGQDPVSRHKRRSHSSQPGGRVRRMSLRASGQGEGDKKEITFLPGAETTAHEAVPFVDSFDERDKPVLSPKKSPRKVILNGDLPMTPKRLEGSGFAPVTPSMSTKSSKSGSSNKSLSSKKSRKSQSTPTGTDLAAKSPKPKIIKTDDVNTFEPLSPNRASRTSKNLKSSLNKLRSSRRASLTGAVDDDAKSVVSTISRLQRRMSLHSSPKAQEPANALVW
jgi:hypothetical protein